MAWLSIALGLMTAVALALAWKLRATYRPGWTPGAIEVNDTEALTPMKIDGDALEPADPHWVGRLASRLREIGLAVEVGPSAVTVRFPNPVFVAGIVPRADAPLNALAAALAEKADLEVLVLGHAGDDPMPPGSAYRTGAELAFARAVTVVNHLRAAGARGDLLAGVGPALFPPGDPASRPLNRTVTLILRPIP